MAAVLGLSLRLGASRRSAWTLEEPYWPPSSTRCYIQVTQSIGRRGENEPPSGPNPCGMAGELTAMWNTYPYVGGYPLGTLSRIPSPLHGLLVRSAGREGWLLCGMARPTKNPTIGSAARCVYTAIESSVATTEFPTSDE